MTRLEDILKQGAPVQKRAVRKGDEMVMVEHLVTVYGNGLLFPRSTGPGITFIACYQRYFVTECWLGINLPWLFLRHKDRAQQLERNNKKLLERAAQSGSF